ncbi:hypothetical protein SY27_05070 [Flavobacterium sp. 316]|uniref:hypothetical protein n=1 Tax=Flavobacterium sp. 316 TaxID=1603293 RepID=UPI0005DBE3C4|nr:hypothetical protein [Flavobacterium sp. 316]KIX22042.1 hypothetical protein SY27_05070 [Flavobacterium sp. 316]
MAEVISNTQGQNLTTSNQGTNVRAVIQPVSHFVLQTTSGAITISESNSFGAVNPTQFRTTSKITFTGSKKVYALCQGQVLVQPQIGNTSKVNLILKPFAQPIKDLGIKYIIYRGLNKSDFVANDVIVGDENNGTEFIKHIWKEFNQFYSTENTNQPKPTFAANFIGFPTTTNPQTDLSVLIDTFFYKLSETLVDTVTGEATEPKEKAFELPMVKRGMYLGDITGELGIDIVLNSGEYYIENDPTPFKFDLNYARATDFMLDLASATTPFQEKLLKEVCTKFIDIVAFYGLHANGSGKIYVDETATPLTTKDTIFGLLTSFYTKNTQYIYLQANRQRSYNFYENYKYSEDNANNIKIGTTLANGTETTFGHASWPIHKVANNENLYIQLTTDNYSEATLYVKLGNLQTSHENNFVRNTNLLHPASEDPSITIDYNYTQTIGFQFEKSGTEVIASIVQLIYEGKQLTVSEYIAPPIDTNADPIVPSIFYLKDIDDIFGLLNAKSFIATKNENELPSVIEEELQLIHFPNALKKTDVAAVKVKKIEDFIKIDEDSDLQRVTFETLLVDIKQNQTSFSNKSSTIKDGSTASSLNYDSTQNNFYTVQKPYLYYTDVFNHVNNEIIGLRLLDENGNKPSKKIFGVTKSEFQQLQLIIESNQLINSKIYFKTISENKFITSLENVLYKFFSLAIIGEKTDGIMKVYEIQEPILIFTLDDFVYFTKSYSEYMPLNGIREEIAIDYKVIEE